MVAPMIKVFAAAKIAMAIPTTQPSPPPPTGRDLRNFFNLHFSTWFADVNFQALAMWSKTDTTVQTGNFRRF